MALKVARRIDSLGVIEAPADAICLHGIPEHSRYDDNPEGDARVGRKDRTVDRLYCPMFAAGEQLS
ncbi:MULTISPECIES: hypothetical protein [unclassified Methylobacterium]|uniref:hypothetical protein n=1 Tax=unclassified Methylobacterium TaxID=2615210 RepID=UPI003700C2CF